MPTLTGFQTALSFDENTVNATPQLLDADVVFTDAEGDFDGGVLTLSGLLAEDTVSVRNQGTGAGQIGLSGANVTFGGVVIGTLAGGSGTTLTINFNAAATSEAIDALIQNLTYANNSDSPTASHDLVINVIDAAGAGLIGPPALTERFAGANPFDGLDVGLENAPALADLDDDGDLDAVVVDRNGTPLNYLENTGTATAPVFTARTGVDNPFDDVFVGFSQATPTFADLDGDGDLDALFGTARERDGVLYFENTGTPSAPVFTERTGTANPFDGVVIGDHSAPTFADLDGDGDLDAVVGEYYGGLRYFENTGTASAPVFTARTGTANPFDGVLVEYYSTPTFTDLDGDGYLELVVGSFRGDLRFYEYEPGVGLPISVTVNAETDPRSVVPTGNDIQVNTQTDGNQVSGVVTALADGGFVVVWISYGLAGPSEVHGQRFDASGMAIGGEFRVNTQLTSEKRWPAVAGLSDGSFVVVWNSVDDGQDGNRAGVFGQRYDAAGNAVGVEFQVNTYTFENQWNPAISVLEDDSFLVTWMSFGQDGDDGGVYGQRYDASGAALGGEFMIHNNGAGDQRHQQSAGLPGGGFIVVWADRGSATDPSIQGRVFDASGVAVGVQFQIAASQSERPIQPAIAVDANGGFVVVWASLNELSGHSEVYGQRFDSLGDPVGPDFRVTTSGPASQGDPSVVTVAGGGFVVTWTSTGQDGDQTGVYGQRYGPDGHALGDEFLINQTVVGRQEGNGGIGGASLVTLAGGDRIQVFAGAGEVFFRRIEFHTGTAGADSLNGTDGDDSLFGLDGSDTLDGGAGVDLMTGGLGDDTYFVTDVGDTVVEAAGEGTDTVRTSLSSLQLAEHVENLTYTGSDAFTGVGNALNNVITGAAGDDILSGGGGVDVLIGGGGIDTVDYSAAAAGMRAQLNTNASSNDGDGGTDSFSGIENLTGSAFNDTLVGNNAANVLSGGLGSDVLVGLGGNDILRGGTGASNTLQGGLGDDTYVVDANDTVIEFSGEGTDTIQTSRTTYLLKDHFENLQYTGSSAFRGTGNAASNSLGGGSGDDTLQGRAGNDTLNGNAGSDTADYSAAAGAVDARLNRGVAGNDGDGGSDVFISIENLTGSAFNDTLVGNNAANVLSGGLGSDVLLGLGGNDILRGGTGASNTLQGGLGDDTYVVDANDTVIEFSGEGTDTIQTSRTTYLLKDHFENLTFTGSGGFDGRGNALDNVINGGAANDVLTGGLGNDTLNGGAGTADVIVLAGALANYTVTDLGGGNYRIVDSVGGRDGTDTTTGIERVRFASGPTVALSSLAVPAPAPLEQAGKDEGDPQVLPGLTDDGFLPLSKGADMPLVLPGSGDPFADLFVGPGRLSLERGSDSPWQMLTLDPEATPGDPADGFIGARDHSGWNHDVWLF